MNNCNKKPYAITHVSELDIDDLATIPDYFLAIRAVEDESDGNTIYTPVRVPGARVMPTGNLANIAAITTNNTSLEIPENQVLAGYMEVQPGGNVMRLADENHPAEFLMVSNYANGKMLIQASGFLTIPGGHQYTMSQYYLGANGEPVTDATVTGQKLFKPVDEYTLIVNMDF